MVRSPTKPSTKRLSEVARHVVLPSGIVSTGWPAVEAKCAEWGDVFDEWQRGLGRVILGKRADGLYAATVGGVGISIPRQVAKTFLVGRIIFALAILFPGLKVLWTAHRQRTSAETFRKLAGLARRKKVAPHILAVRQANDQQEIAFRNGSRILFGAREQGFGRGFDEVDVEVFDEAQILTEKALDDMVAATNQSRHPHGALLFFMGTPPRPGDPSEAFTLRRKRALEVERARAEGHEVEFDALWVECSADPEVGTPHGPSLDDRAQWRKANPSFPHRTPLASMLRMRANLAGDDSWRREALGVWDDEQGATRLITPAEWEATGVKAKPDGVKSFGVAFSRDGKRLALAGSVRTTDDRCHVELIDGWSGPMEAGVAKLADWLAERWRDTARIALAGPGAAVLLNALRDRKVPARVVHVMSTPDYLAACAMFYDGIRDHTVTHLDKEGQRVLDQSVAVSDRKVRGQNGAWGWQATTLDGDETPVEAASAAVWASRTRKRAYSGGAVMA